jgi:hypothetical protein
MNCVQPTILQLLEMEDRPAASAASIIMTRTYDGHGNKDNNNNNNDATARMIAVTLRTSRGLPLAPPMVFDDHRKHASAAAASPYHHQMTLLLLRMMVINGRCHGIQKRMAWPGCGETGVCGSTA